VAKESLKESRGIDEQRQAGIVEVTKREIAEQYLASAGEVEELVAVDYDPVLIEPQGKQTEEERAE
jgi:hypothetical protein